MNTVAIAAVASVIAFGILFLIYDNLHNNAGDWLAANANNYPVQYPWFVRFDFWLYHANHIRVENIAFEAHHFFGNRLNYIGQAIHYR